MSNNICGCGECDFCLALTAKILSEQAPEERAFDRYMQRPPRQTDESDDEGEGA